MIKTKSLLPNLNYYNKVLSTTKYRKNLKLNKRRI